MPKNPSMGEITSFTALALLGVLAIIMCFAAVPQGDHDYLVFILGGLVGALSTAAAGAAKTALGKDPTDG